MPLLQRQVEQNFPVGIHNIEQIHLYRYLFDSLFNVVNPVDSLGEPLKWKRLACLVIHCKDLPLYDTVLGPYSLLAQLHEIWKLLRNLLEPPGIEPEPVPLLVNLASCAIIFFLTYHLSIFFNNIFYRFRLLCKHNLYWLAQLRLHALQTFVSFLLCYGSDLTAV